MGRKPKKKNGPAAGKFTEQQILNNTLKIFKEVCAKLTGPNGFRELSSLCVLRIISSRYPALRLRGTESSGIDPAQVASLNEIFKNMVRKEQCLTPIGETLPLSIFMREGLMLLHYVEIMGLEGLPGSPFLKQACLPYERQSDHYLEPVRTLIQILFKFCVVLSDWNRSILVYDINQLCALKSMEGNNEIPLTLIKPKSQYLTIDTHQRELIPLSWSSFDGEIKTIHIKPRAIGFKDACNTDELCQVFIQRHALQRLQERIGLIPGLMHEAIYKLFEFGEFTWHKRSEKRIVAYSILDKKIGYLVCSLNENMIIIRSFLFLTNTGTPEGNKLSELTSLEPLDKKYLEIDTLHGLAGYRIAENPRLSELFTNAGCEDLLELSELTKFSKQDVKSQNLDSLISYLSRDLDITMNNNEDAETLQSLQGEQTSIILEC